MSVSTAGSDNEFTAFVRQQGLSLARLATLLAGGRLAGEDLLQGALEKTYLRWSRSGGIEDPEAYVRAALVNSARNSWRRRARHPERLMSHPPDATAIGSDASVVERQVLLAALSRLPAQQRAVIVLRYFEDLSEATVAGLLGCSTGTVKKQASRALIRLRADRDLAPKFDDLQEWAHD